MATGPLTSPALSRCLQELLGDHLYFYDAIAPIVTAESVDRSVAFAASRYGKGGEDYLNCPLSRDEYYRFVEAVRTAATVPTKDFERCLYFRGLHADRGNGAARARHAGLRTHASGGAH